MKTSKRYFLPFIVVAMVASLSSCNSNQTSRNIESEKTPTFSNSTPTPSLESQKTPTPSPTITQLTPKSNTQQRLDTQPFTQNTPSPTSKAVTGKSTSVTLYTSDDQCQALVPKKVTVSSDEPVASAVGKILEERDTADFSLSGYRVSVKNNVATVDLRISPQSKRLLTSLSSCEQFALFGSLRKTLTSNAQWNIKDVRFTEKGQEIVL